MSKQAVELAMTGDYVRFPSNGMSNYDSTKHNIGPIICQMLDSWTGSETFIGPAPISVARPMETTVATAASYPSSIQVSPTKWYVMLADISTAATLRKFLLFEYNLGVGFTYIGSISFTFPTAATIRGIRFSRVLHNTGTVSVSGTTVTGSSTTWLTRRVNAGSRIGFGSDDPTQITTWYEITPGTAISSNTSLTVTSTPGTIAAGTSYVIEDYCLYIAATCATTTDGGLRAIKGLNPMTSCFSTTSTATVISLATTVDNIRSCVWLKDASTVTNTVAGGIGLEDPSGDNLTQYAYLIDGASTTAKFFKYNVKAALTLSSGVATNAFVLATGTSTTLTGNVSQAHNCRIATLKHGTGNNVACLYFTTASRLYRVPLTSITSGATTHVADFMLEVPPGGTSTLSSVGATFSGLEIFDSIDRIGWFTTSAAGVRHYVTRYRTDSSQLDHVWLSDDKVQHPTAADATAYPYASSNATALSSWGEGGMVFVTRSATTSALNQMYAWGLGAHWGYQNAAPYNVYITPSITTPGAIKYTRVLVASAQQLGGDVLGMTPDGFKIYYRTTGITDNSGSWSLVPIDRDLGGIAAASAIQFKFEFKTISEKSIPGRILGLAVLYESSDALPSNFEWNLADSSNTDGTVGFDQLTLVSATIAFQIDYYRSDNQANVLTQTSASTTNGVFEYWNGSGWSAGVGTDTIGLRRRFRPTAGLPSGINVYAKIKLI